MAQNSWDLTVDAMGNIALATDGYAIAQDVATTLRLFAGELYFDTLQGIPYFAQILGKLPPAKFVKTQFESAARTVPGVASATCFLTGFANRRLSGQVQITTTAGETFVVASEDITNLLPFYVSAVSPEAAGSPTGGP